MRSSLTFATVFLLAAMLSAQENPAAVATNQPIPPTALEDRDLNANTVQNLHGTPERPVATIETTDGTFRCALFPAEAPKAVDNFIGLATGMKDWIDPASGSKRHHIPLYPGTIFHRVIPEFMIQGGDPLGTGDGEVGIKFEDEFSDSLSFDRPGRLAMANSGPATNGSQFFITEVALQPLDRHHTIFGQCDNIELVQQIARMARDPRNDKPTNPVSILRITVDGAKLKNATPPITGSPQRVTTAPQQ